MSTPPTVTTPLRRGLTWRQRCDLSSCLISQHPTRGRPQFTTPRALRSGSPGTFSEYKHFDGELYRPETPRAHSASSLYARHSTLGSMKLSEKSDSSAALTKDGSPTPWLAPSRKPGIPSEPPQVERQPSSRAAAVFTRTRSQSSTGRDSPSIRRDPFNASGEEAKGPSVNRGASQKALQPTVAALLHRDLSRRSKEQLAREETQKRVRAAINTRFANVTSVAAGEGGSSPSRQQEDPQRMHRVPHDSLRVSSYDRGRKMTTSALAGLEENGQSSHLSPGTAPASTENAELTARLWLAVHRAADAVKALPPTYFEALRTLRSVPPKKVLFTLHLAVLMVEPHSSIPLPPNAIWPAARDVLRPGDFAQVLTRVQLEDHAPERITALKRYIADTAPKLIGPGPNTNSNGTDAGHSDGAEQAGTQSRRFDDTLAEVIQSIEAQSRESAVVLRWIKAFIEAHDHIVRPKNEATSNEPAGQSEPL